MEYFYYLSNISLDKYFRSFHSVAFASVSCLTVPEGEALVKAPLVSTFFGFKDVTLFHILNVVPCPSADVNKLSAYQIRILILFIICLCI